MHPEFIHFPSVGFTIKTYGFCLMVGFLTGIWLAMRRAQRLKVNPDIMLDIGFLCLIFGVGGARVFYVIHYWKTPAFMAAENKLFAIIDITQGGLEFLGGFIGATLAIWAYLSWKKLSVRMYLDIFAPSCMWGLAFGRLGCFFNGCCFGGVCAVAPGQPPQQVWAVNFPYGSPAHWRQWESRDVTVPADLILTHELRPIPSLLPPGQLAMSVESRERPTREYEATQKRILRAESNDASPEKLAALKKTLADDKKLMDDARAKQIELIAAMQRQSRVDPARMTSASELAELAKDYTSLGVHPTQLYSSIHAFLLSTVLVLILYARKRHGVVAAALLLLYPIPRMLLELIRVDNPRDVGVFTASQFVSLGMIVVGALMLYVLYKKMPERSPLVALEAARYAEEKSD